MVEFSFLSPEAESEAVSEMSNQYLIKEMVSKVKRTRVPEQLAVSSLYQMIRDGKKINPSDLQEINRKPMLRKLFFRIIDECSVYRFNEAVAASSGSMQRVVSGCKITIEPSLAETNQIYLIIEFQDETSNVSQLVTFDDKSRAFSIELPAIESKVCQLLLDKHHPILSLILKPSTIIFLK